MNNETLSIENETCIQEENLGKEAVHISKYTYLCPNCGNILANKGNYCWNCGQKVFYN